jgi:hypothetical protein
MMKKDPWFFQERAVAFASLVLTKQNDVIVRAHAGHDIAVDLLVEIRADGNSPQRLFGVQIVPYMDLPDIRDANERVLSHFPGDHLESQMPICVFVIGIRKPEGIYSWGVEPVIDDGRAVLHRDVEKNWQPLDEAGSVRLIGQVNAWYDALNGGCTPFSRGQHSKIEK